MGSVISMMFYKHGFFSTVFTNFRLVIWFEVKWLMFILYVGEICIFDLKVTRCKTGGLHCLWKHLFDYWLLISLRFFPTVFIKCRVIFWFGTTCFYGFCQRWILLGKTFCIWRELTVKVMICFIYRNINHHIVVIMGCAIQI